MLNDNFYNGHIFIFSPQKVKDRYLVPYKIKQPSLKDLSDQYEFGRKWSVEMNLEPPEHIETVDIEKEFSEFHRFSLIYYLTDLNVCISGFVSEEPFSRNKNVNDQAIYYPTHTSIIRPDGSSVGDYDLCTLKDIDFYCDAFNQEVYANRPIDLVRSQIDTDENSFLSNYTEVSKEGIFIDTRYNIALDYGKGFSELNENYSQHSDEGSVYDFMSSVDVILDDCIPDFFEPFLNDTLEKFLNLNVELVERNYHGGCDSALSQNPYRICGEALAINTLSALMVKYKLLYVELSHDSVAFRERNIPSVVSKAKSIYNVPRAKVKSLVDGLDMDLQILLYRELFKMAGDFYIKILFDVGGVTQVTLNFYDLEREYSISEFDMLTQNMASPQLATLDDITENSINSQGYAPIRLDLEGTI